MGLALWVAAMVLLCWAIVRVGERCRVRIVEGVARRNGFTPEETDRCIDAVLSERRASRRRRRRADHAP